MKELECEVICKQCRASYGRVFRVQTDTGWRHESEPEQIKKYCSVCEQPTERR